MGNYNAPWEGQKGSRRETFDAAHAGLIQEPGAGTGAMTSPPEIPHTTALSPDDESKQLGMSRESAALNDRI